MKKPTKHLLLICFLLITFGVLQPNLWADHSWGNYHWSRSNNPFNLQLGDNVSSVWDPHLATTSSDWTQSSVLNTTIVAGQAGNVKKCRPGTGRVEVCNSTYGNNGWLGVAQIWVSGSHITKGAVKLNDTYFNSPPYNTSAWRNLVSCQEVGHIFGLDHQDEDFDNPNLGTCMDYTNNPNTNQHPNQHDYNQLVTIYSHLDLTSAPIGLPPAAMNEIDFATPSQWGRVISKSRDGLPRLYILDFGGGHKVFTFVIWATANGERDHDRNWKSFLEK